ncbi:MAG: formylglycine-generating enzyme family protein [Alphaproteobacteria bacterium]
MFSASALAEAGRLPADSYCAQTPFHTPRMVPEGERSVLDNLPKKPPIIPENPKKVSTYKLNMVKINPGTFTLGSPRSEAKRERFEGPVQSVTIDYTFEVGAYEVTHSEWETCLAGGGCRGYRPDDKGWGRGRRPVNNISWDDAQSYIRWLNAVTGLKYRLLSEAEFEYVARAGTTTPFYTGQAITAKQANFNGKYPYLVGEPGVYRSKTIPVGSFKPNGFGVYDILGNAFEWTQDCWNESHAGAPNNGHARKDGNCKFRLMKGGSWVTHASQIRAAKRTRYDKSYRYEDYGFRIARTLE